MTQQHDELFFLAVGGDGCTGKVLRGREAVRRELTWQFFGDDGPDTDAHREEDAARWASFCNTDDEWEFAHGEPFAWQEHGEDYHLSVTIVTEPLPAEDSETIHGLEVRPVVPATGRKGIHR